MYAITHYHSWSDHKLMAISTSRANLEWYLREEGMKHIGNNPAYGSIYTKKGEPLSNDAPFWIIDTTDVIVL